MLLQEITELAASLYLPDQHQQLARNAVRYPALLRVTVPLLLHSAGLYNIHLLRSGRGSFTSLTALQRLVTDAD